MSKTTFPLSLINSNGELFNGNVIDRSLAFTSEMKKITDQLSDTQRIVGTTDMNDPRNSMLNGLAKLLKKDETWKNGVSCTMESGFIIYSFNDDSKAKDAFDTLNRLNNFLTGKQKNPLQAYYGRQDGTSYITVPPAGLKTFLEGELGYPDIKPGNLLEKAIQAVQVKAFGKEPKSPFRNKIRDIGVMQRAVLDAEKVRKIDINGARGVTPGHTQVSNSTYLLVTRVPEGKQHAILHPSITYYSSPWVLKQLVDALGTLSTADRDTARNDLGLPPADKTEDSKPLDAGKVEKLREVLEQLLPDEQVAGKLEKLSKDAAQKLDNKFAYDPVKDGGWPAPVVPVIFSELLNKCVHLTPQRKENLLSQMVEKLERRAIPAPAAARNVLPVVEIPDGKRERADAGARPPVLTPLGSAVNVAAEPKKPAAAEPVASQPSQPVAEETKETYSFVRRTGGGLRGTVTAPVAKPAAAAEPALSQPQPAEEKKEEKRETYSFVRRTGGGLRGTATTEQTPSQQGGVRGL